MGVLKGRGAEKPRRRSLFTMYMNRSHPNGDHKGEETNLGKSEEKIRQDKEANLGKARKELG